MSVGACGGGVTRRGVAGVLGVGLLELLLADAAFAQDEGGPQVHTRSEWKALAPRKKAELLDAAPDRIVVHHTATPNFRYTSLAHAYRLSRAIQGAHLRRGWDDVAQQLTISRGGHVMEGRNRSLEAIRGGHHVVGAHVRHHNEHAIGIENEGDYRRAPVPGRLWKSLVVTCSWLCDAYRLDPAKAIVGHRDLVATDCPGNVLYASLPRLRVEVARRLAHDWAE